MTHLSHDFRFQAYHMVGDIPSRFWASTGPEEGLFLGRDYLTSMENAVRAGSWRFIYVSVMRDGEPCGLLYFTLVSVNLAESLSAWKPVRFLSRCLPLLRWRFLVCGNLLVSGAPGVVLFNRCRGMHAGRLVEQACVWLDRQHGLKASYYIVKDLPAALIDPDVLSAAKFRALVVPPIMQLPIGADWHQFGDYLTCLTSKYRTVFKKYRRAAAAVVRSDLDRAGVHRYAEELDRLYAAVYEKASFKGPFLGSAYLAALKEALGDNRFKVTGYFLDHALVAFNSTMVHRGVLYSSFFGYDEKLNDDYFLFKNILLDDIEYAIEQGLKEVNFGRATYEVKSALGAEPVDQPLWMSPVSPSARLILPVFKAMFKPRPWSPRHPFKSSPSTNQAD